MAGPSIRKLLSGGDLRSIGRVPEVLKIVGGIPERLGELVGERESGDPVLRGYLDDRSVIVRACALQAMVELAGRDPALLAPVKTLVEVSCRKGPPALRARGRKLLAQIGEGTDGL